MTSVGLGRGRYTLICNEQGGIIDDCIFYHLSDEEFLLVANAGNFDDVWKWVNRWRDDKFTSVVLENRTLEVGMIALQGPLAATLLDKITLNISDLIRPFTCRNVSINGVELLVARTGYTGEDGFEIMPDTVNVVKVWRTLLEAGAMPCGLGSRDVLRLEAGLLLHGNDMDVDRNPFDAGLNRFVNLASDSVSTPALRRLKDKGAGRKLAGFKMVGRGIARHGYTISHLGKEVGEVTSGGYSPTLDMAIGLGYVSKKLAVPGCQLTIDVRGKAIDAEVVDLPFYSRRRI
ncbi:MAG: glycine cleavage system protein T [SAR202 cluster bacterium Io17-Chloro-G3]|nr:MAG: glycine cleavage system protein T [SAR202 cluster bacterium Io17-Chloro-G3]